MRKVYKINFNLDQYKTNDIKFSQRGNNFEIRIYESYSDMQMYVDIYFVNSAKWLCLGRKLVPNIYLLDEVEYKTQEITKNFNFVLADRNHKFHDKDIFFEELDKETTHFFYEEW